MRVTARLTSHRTVKARAHHGATSLDLTLPADLCRALDVRPGDVFAVDARDDGGRVVITYVRVVRD